MPDGLHWRFAHVGGGPLAAALAGRARELGLGGRIVWCGPLAHDRVLAHYRDSDLFVLPSRIAADGDRDGLPNVLMEAQSQSLACVATRLSGIPELIEDGVTGRLVPAGDSGALTRALAELMTRPAWRQALAEAGALRVRRDFDCTAGIAALADRFGAR